MVKFLKNWWGPILFIGWMVIEGLRMIGPTYILPSGGDDWAVLQNQLNKTGKLYLGPGAFHISKSLTIDRLNGKDYGQSWCHICGVEAAQNTPGNYVTTIYEMSGNTPAIILQQAKGAVIENIQIIGRYQPPTTQYQVFTYRRSQWRSWTRDCPTSPYAGIAIDPFSDPSCVGGDTTKMYPGMVSYYLVGMSRSGSTAIQIKNCNIQNFNVDVQVTAMNQQNGENIIVKDCQLGNAMSGFSSSQAQAKQNKLINNMFWGVMHTDVDGMFYGLPHPDGSTMPIVEGANIAGMNYQFVYSDNRAMPQTYRDIDAENIVRIGMTGGQYSVGGIVHFEDCKFHIATGGPVPPFWYHGAGTHFSDCTILYYNAGIGTEQRLVLNDWANYYERCSFGAPPVLVLGQGLIPYPLIQNVIFMYPTPIGRLTSNSLYDSVVYFYNSFVLTDTINFKGYMISSDTTLKPGVLLLGISAETLDSLSIYQYIGKLNNYQTPIGYADHWSGDTLFISDMSLDSFYNPLVYPMYKCLYKN